MRKMISFAVLAVALLVSSPANAQIQFGLKGGLNVNKAKLAKSDLDAGNRAGFFIGPTAQFTVPIIGIGADISVLYDNKVMKVTNDNDVNQKKTLNYIDIPINLRYTYGFGNFAGIFIATGPQFAFNLDGKRFSLKDIDGTAQQYELKKSEFSWNLGGGVSILNHLQLAYNYNFGIGKTAEFRDKSDYNKTKGVFKSFKNRSHQISLTYLF